MVKRMRGTEEPQSETEEPYSESDDSVVRRSRRQQHGFETPASSCTLEAEVPGAPLKKRQRLWRRWEERAQGTTEDGTDGGESDSEAESDVWVHAQPLSYGCLATDSEASTEREQQLRSSGGETEGEDGSDPESLDAGFVVDDDDASVAAEVRRSEHELARMSVAEVRMDLEQRVRRCRTKLDRAEARLAKFECEQEAQDLEDAKNGVGTQR